MRNIDIKLFNFLEIGDSHPIVIMGVINLSPESFYKGSVLKNLDDLSAIIENFIQNGGKIIDIGARSTAPWSEKINVDQELKRIIPVIKKACELIPQEIVISIDTQYKKIAEECYKIIKEHNHYMILNDVSNLKTDITLKDFLIEKEIPVILMASKKALGDLLLIEDVIEVLQESIISLESEGYAKDKIIIDPGIGAWIKEKTFQYDIGIINNLHKLRILNKPILVAISRKSFIGNALSIPDPKDRYFGTLSSTAIAVYNGTHIVRTHDVNKEFCDLVRMAKIMREYGKNHI
jgi:dihydropteroate synthase